MVYQIFFSSNCIWIESISLCIWMLKCSYIAFPFVLLYMEQSKDSGKPPYSPLLWYSCCGLNIRCYQGIKCQSHCKLFSWVWEHTPVQPSTQRTEVELRANLGNRVSSWTAWLQSKEGPGLRKNQNPKHLSWVWHLASWYFFRACCGERSIEIV